MNSLPVYTGYWTDYSKSSIHGATVTLTSNNAFTLISGLSIFVAIVGSRLWAVVALFFFEIRHTKQYRDGFYFQLQALLANTDSPFDIMKLCWAWRSTQTHGKRADGILHAVLISCVRVIIIFGFIFAGIFVSIIAASPDSGNVLVKKGSCGVLSFEPDISATYKSALIQQSNTLLQARAYARSCYSSDLGFAQCSLYPEQHLPYRTTRDACPFGNDPNGTSLCLTTDRYGLKLYSTNLNSNKHLGINSGLHNQIAFQYNVTCSPIRIDPYIQEVLRGCETTIYEYNLGSVVPASSWTFLYNTDKLDNYVGYQISSVFNLAGSASAGGWYPIAPLRRKNGDVSVQFLTPNGVKYLQPVHDPWFSATSKQYPPNGGTIYEPDNFVSAMGCVDQYQICNPRFSQSLCTIATGLHDLKLAIEELEFNVYQSSVAKRLLYALQRSTTYQTIIFLKSNALLAEDHVDELLQSTGLPNNQWEVEVTGWYETQLAKIQQISLSYVGASPGLNLSLKPLSLTKDEEEAANNQCYDQRIKSPGSYTSISFLGLMIVIGLGSIIVVLSFAIETVLRCTRKCLGKDDSKKKAERLAYKLPQLVKQVLVREDVWETSNFNVPVTFGSNNRKETKPTSFHVPVMTGAAITFQLPEELETNAANGAATESQNSNISNAPSGNSNIQSDQDDTDENVSGMGEDVSTTAGSASNMTGSVSSIVGNAPAETENA